MITALYIYCSIGILVLLLSPGLRTHILTGLRVLVLEYLSRKGVQSKLPALPGFITAIVGTMMALFLYPVICITRSRQRKVRKALMTWPLYHKPLPGYPPIYYN